MKLSTLRESRRMESSPALFLLALVIASCGPAVHRGSGPGNLPPARLNATVTRPGDVDVDLSAALPCPAAGDEAVGLGPISLEAPAAGQRWMFSVTQVARAYNSKVWPVEVCGVKGELKWLVKQTCPGGSRPFPNMKSAHVSRAGSVGSGGRCGKIIDLYIVPCPDQDYQVYMDMYHCGPDESFM